MKMRIDHALVHRRIAESRSRAADMIAQGHVTVNGEMVRKASQKVSSFDSISSTGEEHRWVSRGGMKLDHAIRHWNLSFMDKVVLDVGASTGGFTDVSLFRGARKVYALDVGHDQLHQKLRDDARVVNLEGVNAREVSCESLVASGEGEACAEHWPAGQPLVAEGLSPIAEASRPEQGINIIVCDVSFISVKLALGNILAELASKKERGQQAEPLVGEGLSPIAEASRPEQGGIKQLILLIKPQFEVGKDAIPKDGVVKDPAQQQAVCDDIIAWVKAQGWQFKGITNSPILGPKGNKEFLLWAVVG